MAYSYTETIIRGERFKLAFAPEGSIGVDPGTAAFINSFGVIQTATLPDPLLDITPIYALGTNSNRDPYIFYRGRIGIGGSIGDIWLLNGTPLYLAIGAITAGGGGPPYVHTISETTSLPTFALHATHLDSAGSVALMRRWLGGKVNRMTISASEGDFLKCSLDDIQFTRVENDQNNGNPYYSAGVADITVPYPTTEPYLFSYGHLLLNNVEFARLRNFRLEVNNNLEAKYYITDESLSRFPFELREGKREYSFSCDIDASDAALYKELIAMGVYSAAFKGFQIILTFTRGAGDTITITSPTSAPAAGGDSIGCLFRSAPYNIQDSPVVTVTSTITMRNLGIVVSDSLTPYPGEA